MGTETESAGAARAAEDEIKLLLERARAGDTQALPALRATLHEHPELWLAYGDLAHHARSAWLRLIAGDDLMLEESLDRKAAAMLDGLAGPGAPPLERLLAERVVATWLQVNHADAMAARSDVPLKQAAFALSRLDSAHRRHVTAIAALATVRRLLPTNVAIATPASVVSTSDSAVVDIPGETGVTRPADGPCDVPHDGAAGGPDGTAATIPFELNPATARTRRA